VSLKLFSGIFLLLQYYQAKYSNFSSSFKIAFFTCTQGKLILHMGYSNSSAQLSNKNKWELIQILVTNKITLNQN